MYVVAEVTWAGVSCGYVMQLFCFFSAGISETVPRFSLQVTAQQKLRNLIIIFPPYH
jgi:hypothetical protein